jgi:hypothetical protein
MYIHLLLKGNRGAPAVAEGNAEQIAELLTRWATEDLYEVWDGVEYTDAREFVTGLKGSTAPEDKGNVTESVNHPAHYNQYEGLEVWDLVELMTFNLGNAVKYVARAGHKDASKEIEDLSKAIAYIRRELKRVDKSEADYGKYSDLVALLAPQLSYHRGISVLYICRASNEYLSMAMGHLEQEMRLLSGEKR